jgi:hypothetical protein
VQASESNGLHAKKTLRERSAGTLLTELAAPVLDEIVTDDYQTITFNGTLTHPSIFKGPPGPDTDAAWDHISFPPPFRISESDLLRLGGDPRSAVKWPSSVPSPSSSDPSPGYMAILETHHHLHCVNLLWQATHPAWYNGTHPREAWLDNPATQRIHLDHCVDILRQKLMCDADTGIVTLNWVRGRRTPYPNFNVRHKCRDFAKLLEWGWRNGVEGVENRADRQGSVELERDP